MRVALTCPYSFRHHGGVQNHVIGLSGWLQKRGHTVSIMAPGRPDPAVLEASGLDSSQVVSSGPAVPVRYNGSVARVNFGLLEASRVRRWLKDFEPDVIHVHEPLTPSVSVLAIWNAEAPVVATFHTATPGSRAMNMAGKMMRGTVNAIDSGIAVSNVAAQVVRRYIGLEPSVIGNGIDLSAFLAAAKAEPSPRPIPRIVFIGRYDEPRKGFDVFVEAIELVRQQLGDLDVVVAGQGMQRVIPGIKFLGEVTDQQRNELLADCDVYVAPHRGRESFGIVLLEALAAGAAVVASDLPAFREVLTDQIGPVGELAPINDPASLAEQILVTIANPDPARRARGRARAASFDWEQIGPRIEQQLIAAAQRSASDGRFSSAGKAPVNYA